MDTSTQARIRSRQKVMRISPRSLQDRRDAGVCRHRMVLGGIRVGLPVLKFILLVGHQPFDGLGDQLEPADDFQAGFVFRKGVVLDLFAVLPCDRGQQIGNGMVVFHRLFPLINPW